jgi:hypothetical protein
MRPIPLVALAALLLATPAMACSGPSVVISGDFKTGADGWGDADVQFQPQGSTAVLTPQVGTQTARWNAGAELTDLEACVSIAMPATTADATRSYAGMLFWVTDKDNFYQAVVSPNGMFTVARKVAGRIVPTPPVNWMQTSALKLGANDLNTLRVAIEGQNVIVRINDTELPRSGAGRQEPCRTGCVVGAVRRRYLALLRLQGYDRSVAGDCRRKRCHGRHRSCAVKLRYWQGSLRRCVRHARRRLGHTR